MASSKKTNNSRTAKQSGNKSIASAVPAGKNKPQARLSGMDPVITIDAKQVELETELCSARAEIYSLRDRVVTDESSLRTYRRNLEDAQKSLQYCRQLIEGLISGRSFTMTDSEFSLQAYNPAKHNLDSREFRALQVYTRSLTNIVENSNTAFDSTVSDIEVSVDAPHDDIVEYVYSMALRERIRRELKKNTTDKHLVIGAGYLLGVDYAEILPPSQEPSIDWIFGSTQLSAHLSTTEYAQSRIPPSLTLGSSAS